MPFSKHIFPAFARCSSLAAFLFLLAVFAECSWAAVSPEADGHSLSGTARTTDMAMSSTPTGSAAELSSTSTGSSPGLSSDPTGSTGELSTAPTGSTGELSSAPTGSLPAHDTIVDLMHSEVSRTIQGTATWMDSFFGDMRYESELNESYVRVQYDLFKEEETRFDPPEPDVRIRIILPQLRRKTKLVFSGSPKERVDFSAIGTDPENTPSSAGKETDVIAGIQQTLFDTFGENLSIRVGARVHNRKPLFVFGPRYRALLSLDSWQMRFIEEINWTNQDGWDATTTFDAERRFLYKYFFRASNTWSWTEDIPGFLYAVSFGIGQPIDEHSAIGYEWVNSFQTRPIHELTEVALRVRYRQAVLKRKWVYIEIAPQVRFPRTNSFHGLAGILFRVEMLLGNYPR